MSSYVELHTHSSHSLLDGVAHPEALVAQAAACGMEALALTDHDGLYGAVRFVQAAQEAGIKPILGAEVTLTDGSHLTLLAETKRGYTNLCRIITLARRGQPKGTASLSRRDLVAHTEGLIALSGCRRGEVARLILEGEQSPALEAAQRTARIFGRANYYIELQRHYQPGDLRLIGRLLALADRLDLPVVATGNVHYLDASQRPAHDVLTCVRHGVTLEDAGNLLRSNNEARFRSPEEMAELFAFVPSALESTLHIARRCASAAAFPPGGPQALPRFPIPRGGSPNGLLRTLCREALAQRYPVDPPEDLLDYELGVIAQLGLANYFLIVWDIVRMARESGIRCQGRGSAANSLVAHLLGITPIDPVQSGLVFERFLSPERPSPPDIDIDFAADRREEVIQAVYRRYGRDHAAMACTLVTFRARSAVQDTARALGFPPSLVERLASALDVRDAASVKESEGLTASFGDDLITGPFQHLLRIVPQLEGIPRHLGIHNGGMVLSGPPLCDLVPLEPATMEDRVVTQWDKEGLEGAGMIKIDLLGLRMLSAVEDAVTIVEAQTGQRPDLETLSFDDPAVFDMLCRGETIGVFQIESRVQASLVRRFQPRSFADLVVQISLIRPGPVQAQMVHPYLRRREGMEIVRYLHPSLEPALAETLGVIVFQEQVLKVARDLAGFTAGEAELLRRALSHKRAGEAINRFWERFLEGAAARGVNRRITAQVFAQLRAFGGYAFPKSHAAAFAVITYQSAWLRCYHPAAFFAALLRHQPMGFYPAHVVVSEARRRGVEIRPVDVEASSVRATVEDEAIRLGLSVVHRLGEAGSERLTDARRSGPFRSLADFCRRTRLGRQAVEALILAGAFDGWGVPRQQLIWDLQAAMEAAGGPPELELEVPEERARFGFLSSLGRLWTEMAATGITSRAHIISTVAPQLRAMGVTPSRELEEVEHGAKVWVGGVVVSHQRPPTAKGVAFLALEDEGGLVNVVLRPKVYEESRAALRSMFVVVEGQLQRRGEAISVLARRVVAVKGEGV
jgi:error-prone DNA polymerase